MIAIIFISFYDDILPINIYFLKETVDGKWSESQISPILHYISKIDVSMENIDSIV